MALDLLRIPWLRPRLARQLAQLGAGGPPELAVLVQSPLALELLELVEQLELAKLLVPAQVLPRGAPALLGPAVQREQTAQ